MSIYELTNASATVNQCTAPAGTMGQFIEDQKSQCGLIISNVDSVVSSITGWSLLEALFKPIAGDFNAVDGMRQAWGNVGSAAGAVGENYDSLAGQVPSVWAGPASESARSRLSDIGQMHADQAEASGLIAEQLGHIVEVSKATVEVIVVALDFIDSIVQDLILSALAGPVGWLKAGVTAPGKAKKVIALIHDGLRAIEKLISAAKAVVRVLKYLNAGLGGANAMLNFGNTAQHGRAGNRTDETADTGF